MTVKILRPTDWTTYSPTWFHGVVGTNPLGDQDDATYVYEDYSGFFGGSTSLPPLVGYESSDPIALHVRISTEWDGDPGTFQGVGEIHLGTTSSSDSEFASFGNDGASGGFGFYFTNENTTAEYVLPLVLSPPWPSTTTLAGVVSALESGAWLLVNRLDWLDGSGNTTDPVMRLLEAWVEVGETVLSPCYQTLAAEIVGDGVADSSAAYAVLDTYAGPSVLDLTVGFTATTSDATTLVFTGAWAGWDGTSVSTTDLAVTVDLPIVADGSPHDYTHTFTPAEMSESLTTIRTDLSNPGSPAALRFEVSSGSVVITDAWLQVGHKCRTVAPPCHLYPRDDGQGVGSAAVWPPPSSNRPGAYY